LTAHKFRIVFPTGSFYPAQTGGPDNTVYWITKALYKKKHKPVIITTDKGQPQTTPLREWLNTDYGRVIYTRNIYHYYVPVKVIKMAFSHLKNVDILHLTMISYPASWILAILNSISFNKPVIWSSRGELDPPMLLRSPRKKRLVLWLIRKLVRKNKLFFHSTCDAETKYIKNVFGVQSRVIQIPNYMELPERVHAKKEHYLLFVGRIDKKKGIENLIMALSLSNCFRESSFKLKIVGDHNSDYGRSLVMKSVTAGLDDKIEFLGHRSGKEKQRLLAAAWFLIMPSHTENFGIVVTEALAQGTPAIASTGTPWSILQESGAGYWIDNDPATLTATIDEVLILAPEVYEQMSRNSLQLATNNFDIHAKVGEWEAAYLKVAGVT
jgi:glycosyltransferase involved in cell wall biosynthesis